MALSRLSFVFSIFMVPMLYADLCPNKTITESSRNLCPDPVPPISIGKRSAEVSSK